MNQTDELKIVELYNPNVPVSVIAKESGYPYKRAYDTLRKYKLIGNRLTTRRIKILTLRADNPCITMIEISKRVGTTPTQVLKILKHSNLPTKGLCVTKLNVVKLKKENPTLSLRNIASTVGISHQRVDQILTEANLSPKSTSKGHHCTICKNPLPIYRMGKSVKTCSDKCHKEYMKQRKLIDGKVVFP